VLTDKLYILITDELNGMTTFKVKGKDKIIPLRAWLDL
jgi:hypothetical protein